VEFEWDDNKAESNLKKHGVRFHEAATIWLDENALEIPAPDHSDSEERWIRLGFSRSARLLIVAYVVRVEGERIRIISARKAVRLEIDQYHSR
jgi:uncharacterized DUF497 family protein